MLPIVFFPMKFKNILNSEGLFTDLLRISLGTFFHCENCCFFFPTVSYFNQLFCCKRPLFLWHHAMTAMFFLQDLSKDFRNPDKQIIKFVCILLTVSKSSNKVLRCEVPLQQSLLTLPGCIYLCVHYKYMLLNSWDKLRGRYFQIYTSLLAIQEVYSSIPFILYHFSFR